MSIHSITGFIYGEENSKMGHVFSVSLTPVVTCAKGVPCIPACYACRMCRRFKQTRNALAINTRLLMDEMKYLEFEEETIGLIKFKGVKLFRFNVSGDMFSPRYLEACLKIAEACPDTKFWSFTKQYDVLDATREMWLKDHEWPKNFTMILSVWGPYMPPMELRKHFGMCYVRDKKKEWPIPEGAYECKGDCEHCQVCADLKPGMNVVIDQH